MVTNVVKHICPKCGAIDDFDSASYFLDEELVKKQYCCKCHFIHYERFGLFYLGAWDDVNTYDKDGIKLRY